jgi:glucose/mannose transport system substrate-binding protein
MQIAVAGSGCLEGRERRQEHGCGGRAGIRQGVRGGGGARTGRKSTVQDWNQATNLVITDQAAGQIMGDWAQGEFQVAAKSPAPTIPAFRAWA